MAIIIKGNSLRDTYFSFLKNKQYKWDMITFILELMDIVLEHNEDFTSPEVLVQITICIIHLFKCIKSIITDTHKQYKHKNRRSHKRSRRH